MYTDEKRTRVQEEIRRYDLPLFAHLLTPDLFLQAAVLSGLKIIRSPLHLINLVWLALSAARNPELSFANLLDLPLNTLQDSEHFQDSDLAKLLDHTKQTQRPRANRHDPHGSQPQRVSTAAFATARQRMPEAFWVALFFLLAERFYQLHGDVVRWGRYRLLAVDGTRLDLPDYPALRQYFGTASNSSGSHNAQARMVLLQCPLARLPYAYALEPLKVGEVTMARQLLQGLRPEDLVLLDAGFLSYGLLYQIQQQGASFCMRLQGRLNLSVIKELGSTDDVLVDWKPEDSRGQWRKEGCPKSLRLRRLTYHVNGFRPLRLLTNVLSAQEVTWQQWWGLSLNPEEEVLSKGLYNLRWEIETSYAELKVCQQLEGGLRSQTAPGIRYEVAGHLLYYLLTRWLLVESALECGESPLRLSFTEAQRELNALWPVAVLCSAAWVSAVLVARLRQKVASHKVAERPGRQYPRKKRQRRASKRAKKAKPSQKQKAKARKWFGHGWDLSGPKANRAAPPQG